PSIDVVRLPPRIGQPRGMPPVAGTFVIQCSETNTNGTGARVLRIPRDRYFPCHEPPQCLTRSRLAITPSVLLPDRRDCGAWRASDESGICQLDTVLGRRRLSRICPF